MMKQSIKRMVLTATAVTVMVSLAAPAAMAQEVRDHRDGSGEEAPIVRDHRDDSTSTVEEEPYKDPGIRQCDIMPSDCRNTAEEEGSAPHEPQVVCIKAPCPGSSDSSAEEEPYKDPGIRQCDITPVECEGTDESRDSVVVRDHRDGGSKDEEAASAPGGVKVGVQNPSATAPKEAVSAPANEAGQAANSETVYGCAYDDYRYDEEFDTCVPTSDSFGFFPVLSGEKPWPDSAGGYVGLLGDLVSDLSIGVGAGFLQLGLGHYVGDTLVEFGEGGGPIGWAIQGLGYTIGFAGDASGVLVEGIGQVVGGATEVVGEVVDGIGDAAEDAWDEVTSWF